MADILKISTPLVDRNSMVSPNKPPEGAATEFQISEMSKVIKPNPQSELLQQNNGMPTRNEAPAILMNMLRDPAVTASFLKNIYMLQEIINLIPGNNQAMTNEINELFGKLMISPENIANELKMQENDATVFRGALFDMLREAIEQGGERSEVRYAVANLLKSMTAVLSKDEMLSSVSNNLKYLSEQLSNTREVGGKLAELAESFVAPDAGERFSQLKSQTMTLLYELKNSILFTPKMEKIIPLITYNLSRYSDNPDFLQDAANAFMKLLADNEQQKFASLLKSFLSEAPIKRAMARVNEHLPESQKSISQVTDTLSRLISRQASANELSAADSERLEKIIFSLLSSPCNFTPLLHFVIPVDDDGMRAFAEIWIDTTEEEEKGGQGGGSDGAHVLVVFDVEEVGQFEVELSMHGKKLEMNLLCPPDCLEAFLPLRDYAARLTAGTSYSLDQINIGKLERSRSLMDVFKMLPHRRAGIDVKA